ncbi:hypothetical protein [Geoalkalibacter sp.]|uniref:hypothetical protein n=1 Tax=Geoalkalibacter sp. TaxID=3041440 RepID=UPI00272DEA32|nr:hypothetical protein [Geoalkalibacter sp.]
MASAQRSALGADLTGGGKWTGSATGADGKIYCMPGLAADILIIDPVAGTATRTTMGADLSGSGFKWWGCVAAPDGKIYGVPYAADDVLIIDPVAGTATRNNFAGQVPISASKWIGAAVGQNGLIYCIPHNSELILIIDPVAGTAARSAMGASLSGTGKWAGGVRASNGKIYGIPYDSANILVIDPAAGTATRSNLGASIVGGGGMWNGGIQGSNGKIYAVPENATNLLIIDPATNTASRSTLGADLAGGTKWAEGVAARDGKIYCAPMSSTNILIIDPATETATRETLGADLTGTIKWQGFAVSPQGDLYGCPYSATDILTVTPDAAVSGVTATIDGVLSAPEMAMALWHTSFGLQIAAHTPVATGAFQAAFDWSPLARDIPHAPIYILELVAEGRATVQVPISSFQTRLRMGAQSYLQATVPDAPRWGELIAERAHGHMRLYGGARMPGGQEFLEELLTAKIGLIDDQRGAQSQSINLSGHGTISGGGQRQRTLTGVSYRAGGTGKRRYRCMADTFLRPGDLAAVPQFGEQVVVGMITYVVNANQVFMEIAEA